MAFDTASGPSPGGGVVSIGGQHGALTGPQVRAAIGAVAASQLASIALSGRAEDLTGTLSPDRLAPLGGHGFVDLSTDVSGFLPPELAPDLAPLNSPSFTGSMGVPIFGYAALPPAGTGHLAFCYDCLKPGESTSVGTGMTVFDDGHGHWVSTAGTIAAH